MPPLSERATYRSDGGVSWGRLPLMLVTAVIMGTAGGWLLHFLFRVGFYFVVVCPAVVAIGMAVVMGIATKSAHCRSPMVAGGMGLLCGAVCFLGSYYFSMVEMIPQAKWRFDVLPRYIQLRLQTDVIRDKHARKDQAKAPTPIGNYLFFFLDLGACLLPPMLAALGQAKSPYSKEQRAWYQKETFHLRPGQGKEFLAAMEQERLLEFLQQSRPGDDKEGTSSFQVDYVLVEGELPLNHPMYLTVSENIKSAKGQSSTTTLVSLMELTTQEVLTLASRLKELKGVLSSQVAELAGAIPDAGPVVMTAAEGETKGDGAATTAAATDAAAGWYKAPSVSAKVNEVPEAYRQKVRTKGYAAKVNLLDLVTIIHIGAGIGLAIWGLALIGQKNPALGIPLVVIGVPIGAWGIFVGSCCSSFRSNRWINKRLRQEIAARPQTLVLTSDPEVMYASTIPREHFQKVKLTLSDDLYLMKVDDEEREILMEGDIHQWEIPVGSILECEANCFFSAADAQQNQQIWVVRLLVWVDGGTRELLISLGETTPGFRTNKSRKKRVEEMCARIDALRKGTAAA